MIDKLIAIIALLFFCAFLSVVVIWVQEIDLIVVCVAVMAMAAIDFYRMLVIVPRNKKARAEKSGE